jgi:hypothetical protein
MRHFAASCARGWIHYTRLDDSANCGTLAAQLQNRHRHAGAPRAGHGLPMTGALQAMRRGNGIGKPLNCAMAFFSTVRDFAVT